MWCDLKFSQDHNRIIPHFCDHMYGVVYKMWFETTKKARTLTLKQRFCGVCVTDRVYKERDVTWKD